MENGKGEVRKGGEEVREGGGEICTKLKAGVKFYYDKFI